MAYLLALLASLDFGSYGMTYPIAEENLIEVLRKRLNSAEFKEGEWISSYQKSVETPKGRSLPRALRERKFSFDPSIVSKGTKINPLEKHSLREPLLFINGTDQEQIIWAKRTEGTLILTEGNPIELEKQEKRQIYFDQESFLSRKLGIQALPARVVQNGRLLSVEEVPCF